MPPLQDVVIPYAALAFDGAAAARLAEGAPSSEVAGALLLRVVREAASAAAGAGVEPVSVTVDITGTAEAGEEVSFAAAIDRKTRTIVFAAGEARAAGRPYLSVIAVYRIV